MSIKELFETQKELRSVIYDRFPELKERRNLSWLKLALQVELGELANEQRSWKMWSDDREPRVFEPNPNDVCTSCNGNPIFYEGNKITGQCEDCDGCGVHFHNPLLEEYVDCLSFILEIGLEIEFEQLMPVESFNYYPVNMHKHLEIDETFTDFITDAAKFGDDEYEMSYVMYFCHFLGFGETLGFSMDQIIQAYHEKNKINHERQEAGY